MTLHKSDPSLYFLLAELQQSPVNPGRKTGFLRPLQLEHSSLFSIERKDVRSVLPSV